MSLDYFGKRCPVCGRAAVKGQPISLCCGAPLDGSPTTARANEAEKARERDKEREREREREREWHRTRERADARGVRCYACEQLTERACTSCGYFFCPQHGGSRLVGEGWGRGRHVVTRGVCDRCTPNQTVKRVEATAYGCRTVAIVFGLLLLFGVVVGYVLLTVGEVQRRERENQDRQRKMKEKAGTIPAPSLADQRTRRLAHGRPIREPFPKSPASLPSDGFCPRSLAGALS